MSAIELAKQIRDGQTTAVAAVEKVLDRAAPPGFQTPSLAFGADFVMEIDGMTREDLD